VQLQRHENLRGAVTMCENHPDKVKRLNEMLQSKDFNKELQAALKDDKSLLAKKLCKELNGLVQVAGRKTPFSSAQRRHGLTQCYAMCHRFGMPSWFLTFAPDVLHNKLVVRLHFYAMSNRSHPAVAGPELRQAMTTERFTEFDVPLDGIFLTESKLQEMNSANPCAASQVYKLLMELTLKYSFGVEPEYMQKSSTCPRDLDPLDYGVFGEPYAVILTTEEQLRLALHGHMLGWDGITPNTVARCSAFPELQSKITEVLDSMCTTTLRASDHIENLCRRLEAFKGESVLVPLTRTQRFPSHQEHRENGELVAADIQAYR